MKTIAKLAFAAAIALAAASGTATASPPPAATSGPWASVAYLSGGQLVGGAQIYCDTDPMTWGNTTTYDSEVWTYYYMCP